MYMYLYMYMHMHVFPYNCSDGMPNLNVALVVVALGVFLLQEQK